MLAALAARCLRVLGVVEAAHEIEEFALHIRHDRLVGAARGCALLRSASHRQPQVADLALSDVSKKKLCELVDTRHERRLLRERLVKPMQRLDDRQLRADRLSERVEQLIRRPSLKRDRRSGVVHSEGAERGLLASCRHPPLPD